MSGRAETAKSKTPFWAKALLILVVAAVAGGVGMLAGKALGSEEERTVQVVRSVKGEEQVILLTAGITDNETAKEDGKLLDLIDIPWNERKTTIYVDYDAKFGIEGKDVDIDTRGENSYVVTIPEFKGLGISNPEVTASTESNGVLSWSTPEIEDKKLLTELISRGASEKHIDGFRPLLADQAETFYTRIIKGINPDATVEFVFVGAVSVD